MSLSSYWHLSAAWEEKINSLRNAPTWTKREDSPQAWYAAAIVELKKRIGMAIRLTHSWRQRWLPCRSAQAWGWLLLRLRKWNCVDGCCQKGPLIDASRHLCICDCASTIIDADSNGNLLPDCLECKCLYKTDKTMAGMFAGCNALDAWSGERQRNWIRLPVKRTALMSMVSSVTVDCVISIINVDNDNDGMVDCKDGFRRIPTSPMEFVVVVSPIQIRTK